jgi:hypothetical protein
MVFVNIPDSRRRAAGSPQRMSNCVGIWSTRSGSGEHQQKWPGDQKGEICPNVEQQSGGAANCCP